MKYTKPLIVATSFLLTVAMSIESWVPTPAPASVTHGIACDVVCSLDSSEEWVLSADGASMACSSLGVELRKSEYGALRMVKDGAEIQDSLQPEDRVFVVNAYIRRLDRERTKRN